MSELSHIGEAGDVRMVDVGGKPFSRRRAVARAVVQMAPETVRRLRELPKGDALATAQIAGITAAKRTSDLIPLCHPLPLSNVEVSVSLEEATVEIVGLDIYDPIRDEVKSRDVHDINYWMLDDNYDGSNFVVRQVFFCGGDKDEFDDWKNGLNNVALAASRKKAEQTLKIDIDEEAFANAYGHKSRPFSVKKGQKIAVRVISQFGEETTKVLSA